MRVQGYVCRRGELVGSTQEMLNDTGHNLTKLLHFHCNENSIIVNVSQVHDPVTKHSAT